MPKADSFAHGEGAHFPLTLCFFMVFFSSYFCAPVQARLGLWFSFSTRVRRIQGVSQLGEISRNCRQDDIVHIPALIGVLNPVACINEEADPDGLPHVGRQIPVIGNETCQSITSTK